MTKPRWIGLTLTALDFRCSKRRGWLSACTSRALRDEIFANDLARSVCSVRVPVYSSRADTTP